MTVAPATAYDMPGVRAIANSYGNLHDWPDRPDYLDFELRERALWVAHEDGAVVGFAGVVRSVERTHLADLFVARERRGEGIGSRLLAAALPPEGLRTTLRGGRRARPAALRPRRAGAARAAALPRGHAPAGRRGAARARERARPLARARLPRRGGRIRSAAAAAAHGRVRLALPGPHPALRPLLEAGLRIVAADTWMASGPGALDLGRALPDADLG